MDEYNRLISHTGEPHILLLETPPQGDGVKVPTPKGPAVHSGHFPKSTAWK